MSDFIKGLMQQVAENFTKNSGNPDAYISRKQDWADKVVPAKLPGKAVKLPELDEHGVYKGKPSPPGGGGKPVQKSLVVHSMTDLAKGAARGGKYYRRVPTGNPKRPYRYYYSKEEYERSRAPESNLAGPLRADMSIPEAERVIRHLATEHIHVVGANGHVLSKTTGHTNRVELTPAELVNFKSAVITHNHPSGNCLSVDDIMIALRTGAKEIRAVGHRGTYSWKAPQLGGWSAEADAAFLPLFTRAFDWGARGANIRMDAHLKAHGASPGDTTHAAFTQEKFDEFCSEEWLDGYNKVCEQFGWERIEFTAAHIAGNVEKGRQSGRALQHGDLRQKETLIVYGLADLAKGKARGGKYYRRTPTGIPERPWRYWYSKEEYEKEHGDKAHLHGPDVKQGSLDFDAPEAPAPTKSFTVRYTQNGRENWFMFGAVPSEAAAHALASLKANLRGEFQLVSVLETVPEDYESRKRVAKKAVTPRQDAAEATKAMVDSGEYVNDRKSKIEQRGADVYGSARHKAAEWKSAKEAAGSEHAEKMFTRDFLARQLPIDLHTGASTENFKTRLFLHFAFKKLEAEPRVQWAAGPRWATRYYGNVVSIEHADADPGNIGENVTKEEHVRRQRLRYYEGYVQGKAIFEKCLAETDATPLVDVRKKLWRELSDAASVMRNTHGDSDAGARALASWESAVGAGKRSSPAGQTREFLTRATEKYQDNVPALAQATLLVLDGKSANAALGEVQKKNGIDESSFYASGRVERTGPASEYKDPKQGLDLLDKSTGGKYQMRAVQWGKSVTDEEREHHLQCVVDSFQDLTDILGLPPEMASYNGRLGLAIGARGKSHASAHYEPSTDMINLTRASGVGTLAHEWGHFFDYTVRNVSGDKGGTLPSERSWVGPGDELPVHRAMAAMKDTPEWRQCYADIRTAAYQAVREKRMSAEKARDYWLCGPELWARTFERYVQHKLRAAGRENTYLSGLGQGSKLWPTPEHIEALAPHIDKIFDAFRNSDLIKKALVRLANGRPVRVRSMSEL